ITANLRYVDEHRKQLRQQYTSFADFRQRFEVPQTLIDHIVAEGEKQNVKPKDDAELQATMPYLRTQLKALIARDLWDMDEYYAIMNELNDSVRRALELMNN
ncbi:MAG: peptidase S41, partial [Prevotella sp.]|nr:peptidase S41 [Prevotella sp.]